MVTSSKFCLVGRCVKRFGAITMAMFVRVILLCVEWFMTLCRNSINLCGCVCVCVCVYVCVCVCVCGCECERMSVSVCV